MVEDEKSSLSTGDGYTFEEAYIMRCSMGLWFATKVLDWGHHPRTRMLLYALKKVAVEKEQVVKS